MPEKPVVITDNGLFPVLGATVQSQQNSRFNVGLYRLVVVLRPGRPEVRILPVALKKRIAMYFCNALFVLMLFGFRIILVAYRLLHQCTALLPVFHFSADLFISKLFQCSRFFIVVCIHPAVSIAYTHFLKRIDND